MSLKVSLALRFMSFIATDDQGRPIRERFRISGCRCRSARASVSNGLQDWLHRSVDGAGQCNARIRDRALRQGRRARRPLPLCRPCGCFSLSSANDASWCPTRMTAFLQFENCLGLEIRMPDHTFRNHFGCHSRALRGRGDEKATCGRARPTRFAGLHNEGFGAGRATSDPRQIIDGSHGNSIRRRSSGAIARPANVALLIGSYSDKDRLRTD